MMLLAAAILGLCPTSNDVPWPEYRGPQRDGGVDGAAVPLTWSEEENITWKVPVHGRGWSSPVVGDGQIWLTTAAEKGETLSVLAFDLATGEGKLDRVLFEIGEPEDRNALNSYASPSPCLGDGAVFLHFGTYGTVCLDTASGEERWRRDDLHCDHMEGPGSSPLYADGLLYVHLDGGDVQYLVALDAKTGETAWRTDRSAKLTGLLPDLRKAYSTPLLVEATVDGKPRLELISSAATATYGYDPKSGTELWRMDHPGFSMSSRPMVIGDRVIVSTGFMRPELWSFRTGGSGVMDEEARLWRNTKSVPTMPSPVAFGDWFFQISDRGMISCVDLETGESLWRERAGQDQCASLLRVDDRIYTFGRSGKTVVFGAKETFEKLAESKLDGGFMASPAVVGDALILRSETHLYRVEAKGD